MGIKYILYVLVQLLVYTVFILGISWVLGDKPDLTVQDYIFFLAILILAEIKEIKDTK